MTYLQIKVIPDCKQKESQLILLLNSCGILILKHIIISCKGNKKPNIYYFCQPRLRKKWEMVPLQRGGDFGWIYWRDGRAVECGGLENRCPAIAGPGVRIPLSPQCQSIPSVRRRMVFYFTLRQSIDFKVMTKGKIKIKCCDHSIFALALQGSP